MAIGDAYVSKDTLKSWLNKVQDVNDADLEDAIDSVSREINEHCGRQFNDAGSATARVYRAADSDVLYVDDFHTTAGLIIETDDDGDGTFETTWTSDEYQPEPLNGVVEGVPGWPYWVIRAIDEQQFPVSTSKRALVRVTARWGWAAVPKPVLQACRILASETFRLRDTRFGIAEFADLGVMRVGENRHAEKKLAPYVRTPILGGE